MLNGNIPPGRRFAGAGIKTCSESVSEMTLVDKAKKGTITSEMKEAAKKEGVAAEFIRDEIAAGRIVIPRNNRRKGIDLEAIGNRLRTKVNAEQARDSLSLRNLPVLKGVGGRFSELNIGLLHLAIIGVNIQEVLDGAAAMAKRCSVEEVFKNPAYLYATLQTILCRKKGKPIAIMMPFSERLKSTADWYVQLLAESTGKKFGRTVKVAEDGTEVWVANKNRIVNVGRTPVPSRGTNDLHSIQQNNIEGENDKTVTFIRIEKFHSDIKVAGTGDFLEGKYYSKLLTIAQEATEWALARESRPNCTIVVPEINPYYWGQLLFFFEMATAFEGELLDINAFDQPGVEGYKNYMYYKLRKPGIPKNISEEIKKNPLVKKRRFVL